MLPYIFRTTVLVALLIEFTIATIPILRAAHDIYTPATDLSRLASLVPRSSLPLPAGKLKYVVLGIGTQNYTCDSGNESDVPGTTGAKATLYDIGSKLNIDDEARWKVATIAGMALSLVTQQTIFEAYLKKQGYNHILGRHFFSILDNTATPVFALDRLTQSPFPEAQVSKINSTDAPESAYPGLACEGAVPWLYLADRKELSTGGVDTVYRLETAGGKAPATCKGRNRSFEVQYAAQYWIYGPEQV